MKILFYNWDRIDGHAGGGVTVYQRNLVNYLLTQGEDEIFFLNSGYTYTIGGDLAVKKIENNISEKIKTFEIINSPVLAPVQQSILNVRYYLEDDTLYSLIKNFINSVGKFDVIHFNNIEGLSLSVLKLKEDFPDTKFIYSLHNYFPICTMVSLWNVTKNCNCKAADYNECAECHRYMSYHAVSSLRKIFGYFRGAGRLAQLFGRVIPDRDDINLYKTFEEQNIKYINKYIDGILAVSQRVKDIFVAKGFDEKKTFVSYIGTAVAKNQRNESCADINSNPFKIIYMGYMTPPKGFYFFLEALQNMPDDMASDIEVTVVAKHFKFFHRREVKSLNQLKNKFRDVILINGYKHDEQPQLLKDKHLGVVPVLWEDNLPQVAMEQIAYGVPILCSNLGGASELSDNNPDFIFNAGDISDFLTKLKNIINKRYLLKKFWETVKPLTTMEQHVDFLRKIYNDSIY